jgi:hypothetical protein
MDPDGLRGAHAKAIIRLERDEEKCVAVFRPHPALNIGIDHVHDFGSTRSKIIAIWCGGQDLA